jgi:DNA-binding LacI/PurR family transcriptional regulator
MATILDVAKLAGVSKTTVSRVINENGPVNESTRLKIKEAMKMLNYTPNYFAQGMRTSKTKSIGILVPDYTNPFYSELFKGIEEVALQKGYMSIICSTDEDATRELEYAKELVKRQIDGIILCSYKRIRKNIDYLMDISNKIPVVFMDPVVGDEPVSYVVTDGYEATRKATQYLIDKGRKKIGYIKIKGSARHWVTHERYKGYKKALKDSGIELDLSLVYEGDFQMKSGYAGAKCLMDLKNPPDAIMAATDVMAIGVIKYLKYADISVPDEVNVIGFDNISLANLIEPALTTIAQPIRDLGMEAVNIIVKKINDPKMENKQITLDGQLIVRRSTDISKPVIETFLDNEAG